MSDNKEFGRNSQRKPELSEADKARIRAEEEYRAQARAEAEARRSAPASTRKATDMPPAAPTSTTVVPAKRSKLDAKKVVLYGVLGLLALTMLRGCFSKPTEVAQPPTVSPMPAPVVQKPTEVSLTVNPKYTDDGRIIVNAKTNAPEGTEFMTTVSKGSYRAQAKARAVGGAMSFGPFSNGGDALGEGIYLVEVSAGYLGQDADIKKTWGENGRNLTGKYVKQSDYGPVIESNQTFKVTQDAFKVAMNKQAEAIAKARVAALQEQCNNVQIVIGDWSWGSEYDYVTVTGEVENVSGATLENVQALVSFYTESDEFITSADALIKYNPILSGQTSPFEVMDTENPAMSSARLEFKELMGGSIVSMIRKDYEKTCK